MNQEKTECTFFSRTGSCAYGEKCVYPHPKPKSSCIVLIPKAYVPPLTSDATNESDWFEDFVEDILDEAERIGPVEDIICLDNLGPHLIGNTYLKFRSPVDADVCAQKWANRSYRCHTFSPSLCAIDFTDARCHQYDSRNCSRGPSCNFFHVRPLPRWLLQRLYNSKSFFETIHTETKNGWYDPQLFAAHFAKYQLPSVDQVPDAQVKDNDEDTSDKQVPSATSPIEPQDAPPSQTAVS